ncbi:hypothetical protein [Clavibacter michiganensis]|uniref:hypothetical protein n=1 Tax=Clavibacter michiganensis TaxID=28447 RepID=UPI003DA0FE8F
MTDYIWDDANVSFPDWKGTVQLDERMTGPQLHELVGLDSDAWLVVGLHLGGGEHAHDLHVLAVDRAIVPTGGDVFPKIARANGGEIPVTDFLIHNADPYAILKAMTHVLDLRLRARNTVGTPIRVVALDDVPKQD